MAVFKCKMCGGTINFNEGDTVGVCDHCGTKQTLPSTNDDIITNLYNRANNLRLKSEFDRASSVYEDIVRKDDSQAEAHWGIVLCKYGIEYVDDPATGKKIPTCHRTSYEAIRSDADYLAAVDYSDGEQQAIYEAEARAIDRIQKGILEIAKEEKPFDVFICYKETDENGKRTVDSAIANDIYYQLTQEGFKVFYAAITLEDKLGQEYEPYIFAALNSAKVMLVLGTKPEYFNAVWVKNEWSRYLKLIKNDRSKLLIPCYRDMDAYDLPEEFAHLQAQDMSKIGFINDVIRGIRKLLTSTAAPTKAAPVNAGETTNTAPLLKRAFMFLEDGDWKSADEYCEKVLDIDPENVEAYLGKLMAELRVSRPDLLAKLSQPFDNNGNYQKAVKFGNEKLRGTLEGYNKQISERILTEQYNSAVNKMNSAKTEQDYKNAASAFKALNGFKDSGELEQKCYKLAQYSKAISLMNSAKTEFAYQTAIIEFKSIIGFKDSEEKIAECNRKIEGLKAEEENNRFKQAKRRKTIDIYVLAVACVIAFVILLITVIIPQAKYSKAVSLIGQEQYVEAYELLIGLKGFKDSTVRAREIWDKHPDVQLKVAVIGDYVLLGTYEQDNNTSNGKENIEWLVLAKEGDKALVISKYALDCQQYNTSDAEVTWETCSIRKWLNGTFLNSAFSAEEQNSIISSPVTAYSNPSHSMSPGNNTTDKVFLLSINEVNKYFSSDSARQCQGTAYCYALGAYKAGNGNCWWWLRSPGNNFDHAAYVNYDGSVNNSGSFVYDNMAVRPAIWIDISK